MNTREESTRKPRKTSQKQLDKMKEYRAKKKAEKKALEQNLEEIKYTNPEEYKIRSEKLKEMQAKRDQYNVQRRLKRANDKKALIDTVNSIENDSNLTNEQREEALNLIKQKMEIDKEKKRCYSQEYYDKLKHNREQTINSITNDPALTKEQREGALQLIKQNIEIDKEKRRCYAQKYYDTLKHNREQTINSITNDPALTKEQREGALQLIEQTQAEKKMIAAEKRMLNKRKLEETINAIKDDPLLTKEQREGALNLIEQKQKNCKEKRRISDHKRYVKRKRKLEETINAITNDPLLTEEQREQALGVIKEKQEAKKIKRRENAAKKAERKYQLANDLMDEEMISHVSDCGENITPNEEFPRFENLKRMTATVAPVYSKQNQITFFSTFSSKETRPVDQDIELNNLLSPTNSPHINN